MIKKMMLLASMALAAIAFAAPAAQATGPDVEGTENFVGTLLFTVQPGFPGAGSTFGCTVTTHIEGLGSTTANVNTFEPETGSCKGTGAFTGCVLEKDISNAPWVAHTETDHTLVVTNNSGNVTITNTYKAGTCAGGQTSSDLEFASVKATPNPTEGAISTLTISATSTNGAVKASGTVHAENDPSGLLLFTT